MLGENRFEFLNVISDINEVEDWNQPNFKINFGYITYIILMISMQSTSIKGQIGIIV